MLPMISEKVWNNTPTMAQHYKIFTNIYSITTTKVLNVQTETEILHSEIKIDLVDLTTSHPVTTYYKAFLCLL